METFEVITDRKDWKSKILDILIYKNFIIENEDQNQTHIYKDNYVDQYREKQFVMLETYELKTSSFEQYTENIQELITNVAGRTPIYYNFDYSIRRGDQLLNIIIDEVCYLIMNEKYKERVIFMDSWSGAFFLFDDFWDRWKKDREFLSKL